MRPTASLLLIFLLLPSWGYAGEIQAVTYDWPPYNYSENRKITGISTEIVNAVLNRAEIKADFGIFPWGRALMMANTTKNVLIYTMRRIPERENLYKWVGPITPPSNSYLYKLKERKDIEVDSLDDAGRYLIGVIRNDSMHQYLLSRGFEEGRNMDVVTREILNLKKLFYGRIDLIVWTELTLPIKVGTAGFSYGRLEKVFVLWKDRDGYYAAFSKQTPDRLVNKARSALKELRDEGFIESVVTKYLKKLEGAN